MAWLTAAPLPGAPAITVKILVVAGVSAGAGVASAAVSPSLDHILLACIGAVLLVPIFQRLATRTFDVLEPLTIFTVAFGIMFVARPIAMLVSDSMMIERSGAPTYDVSPTFSLMLAAALIGAIGFQLGYFSTLGQGLGRKLKAPGSNWRTDAAVILALVLAMAGVGLFGVFIYQSGGVGALRDLLAGRDPSQVQLFRSSTGYFYSALFLLIPATLIFVAVGIDRRLAVASAVAVGLVALLLLRAGPTGGRMMLLMLVGSLAVWGYLRTGKRPGLGTAILLLLAIFLAITFLRDVRTQSARDEQSVASILATSVSEPGDAARKLLLGGDTDMAAMFALELQVVPSERPHEFGRATAGDLVIRPIPRILWPGKPLSPREDLINSLWPAQYSTGNANPEFSSMAWFYLDAGLPGVFLGMSVLGVLFKAAFVFLQCHRSNVAAQLIYASLVPFMVIALRDSPTDTILRMAFVTLPLVVILILAGQRAVMVRKDQAGHVRY